MKNPPTLIDECIGETFKRNSFVPAEFRPRLMAARKFVLDDSMSAYLTDLTHAAFVANIKRSPEIVNGARLLARLPHRITWVEYNGKARRRRLLEEYKDNVDVFAASQISSVMAPEDEVIPRIGWLLEQHPTFESAFKMSEFFGGPVDFVRETKLFASACPHAYTWTCTDESPPWPTLPWITDQEVDDEIGGGRRAATPSEVATGIMQFRSNTVGIIQTPGVKKTSSFLLTETAGELRAAWTLLATINDLPVTFETVRPSKGYVAKGEYRKYSQHSVITLRVPDHRNVRTLAARAVAKIRRCAHEVRGHLRRDHRNPETPMCEHDWKHVEGTQHVKCSKCFGKRLWITEHQRGDASLGFRLHDYAVTHESK